MRCNSTTNKKGASCEAPFENSRDQGKKRLRSLRRFHDLGRGLSANHLADRNLTRLLGFRNLAQKVNVEQAVLKARAGHMDMVGKLEAPLESAGCDALIEGLGFRLAFFPGLLRAANRQAVFLGFNRQI